MKRKKKIAVCYIPLYIASVLFCITLISTYLVSGLYARYTTESTGNDSARIAAFVFDITDGASSSDLVLDQITKPGDKQEVTLVVKNNKSGQTSEVSQEYTVTIDLVGSMPLVTTLKKSDASVISLATSNITSAGDIESATTTEYTMIAGSNQNDSYVLSVEWPADQNDYKYANAASCGKIVLTIDRKQID